MPESFLQNAQLTGLDRDARRTEILRAKNFNALDTRVTTLEGVTTPTAWTTVTYSNSWVDYAGGYEPVAYRKVGDMVQLRGSMKNGTLSTAAFTLPIGFRPPSGILVFVTQGVSAGTTGYLSIASDGTVTPYFAGNVYVSCDGVAFSVTA